MMGTNLQMLSFKIPKEWAHWLAKNHASSEGIWLQFYKKGSGVATVTYSQALDEALCYGWIDGQMKKHDERSYVQRFTPRRPRSVWSKRNREHVERLKKEGKMKSAGLREAEAAMRDGRWSAAYDPPSTMEIPRDFLERLAKDKKAQAFFSTLNKANTYAIAWRLQTAKKPETREKRMKSILEMLAKGQKFH